MQSQHFNGGNSRQYQIYIPWFDSNGNLSMMRRSRSVCLPTTRLTRFRMFRVWILYCRYMNGLGFHAGGYMN